MTGKAPPIGSAAAAVRAKRGTGSNNRPLDKVEEEAEDTTNACSAPPDGKISLQTSAVLTAPEGAIHGIHGRTLNPPPGLLWPTTARSGDRFLAQGQNRAPGRFGKTQLESIPGSPSAAATLACTALPFPAKAPCDPCDFYGGGTPGRLYPLAPASTQVTHPTSPPQGFSRASTLPQELPPLHSTDQLAHSQPMPVPTLAYGPAEMHSPKRRGRAVVLAKAKRDSIPIKVGLPAQFDVPSKTLDPSLPVKKSLAFIEFAPASAAALWRLQPDIPVKKRVPLFLLEEPPQQLRTVRRAVPR
mmetsp:Transcript_17391/g.38027  ORF Transcript_17391/g.38027 Transcript_17391/m.38027 type:complete len:300 (-) Transcript_17391:96-995(-)